MFAARALTRVAWNSPKAAGEALFASFACKPQAAGASSWTSVLELYGSTNRSTFHVASICSHSQEGKKEETPSSSFAAQKFLGDASLSSSYSSSSFPPFKHTTNRSIASYTPGGGSSAIDTDPIGGGGYMLLSGAHLSLAALCFLNPDAVANFYFPGSALPQGMQTQALVQLLGCGAVTGSAACYALKLAADRSELKSATAQRLQLGLMALAAAAIGTHVMYSPSITMESLASGAAVMGATGGVAYSSYKKNVGSVKVGEVVSRYLGAIPDHLRINNLQSGLFALLTPTLALAGASYLLLPGYSLASVFGYAKDPASFFCWQAIGGSLLTIAPALTYSLKAEADAENMDSNVAKTLSGGLLLAALGHLTVLLPMLTSGQGAEMLPWLVGAWSAAAGAGAMGMLSSSSGSSASSGKL